MASIPLPSISELPGFLGLPLVGGRLELPPGAPRAEDAPDAGFFGPHSVTWRIMREPLIAIGGPRALLMQAAHPLVAAGARQHSFYAADPWRRLKETGHWVATVVYGTRAQANWACRQVNQRHAAVTGKLEPEAATAHVPADTQYRARQHDLARWVHATMLDSLLATYEATVRPLSRVDADRFVREWNPIGRRMGMRTEDEFHSRGDLTRYVDAQIHGGPVEVGKGSMEVAATILQPPIGAAQVAWKRVLNFSLGMLPETLREQYGVTWTPLRRLEFRAACQAMRRARKAARLVTVAVPGRQRLIYSAAYERAWQRAISSPAEVTAPGD